MLYYILKSIFGEKKKNLSYLFFENSYSFFHIRILGREPNIRYWNIIPGLSINEMLNFMAGFCC